MTGADLLRFSLDHVGYQVQAVYKDIDEAGLDTSICSESMTPRQIAGHLCECYLAVLARGAGQDYKWGSYQPKATWTEQWDDLEALRKQASDAVLNGDVDAMKRGVSFMVAHDAYHVGQICLARVKANPDWDIYSIYQMD